MFTILKNLKTELINYYRCRSWKRINNSIYPDCLLPKNRYVSRINLEEIFEHQLLFILRRSNKSFSETFIQVGEISILREDAIDYKEVPNMSVNLMGGKFVPDFLRFIPKDEGIKEWDGRERIFLYEYLKSYSVLPSEPCAIYFDASKIHNCSIPYNRKKDKQVDKFYRLKEFTPPFEEGKYKLTAELRVAHVPTNMNYWHVELKLHPIQKLDESVSDVSPAWLKELSSQANRDVLCASGFEKIPVELTPIPKPAYKKSK
jgi:hypothetical protein